jgi:NADH dehydrogenase
MIWNDTPIVLSKQSWYMKNNQTHIILIGGGYLSVWAYRSIVSMLGDKISEGMVRLTLISPDAHHFFHGWTAESMTCIVQDEHRMSPLLELMPQAKIVDGWAEEIDRQNNLVYIRMKNGSMQQLEYDHLLIGVGSADRSIIPGINANGFRVKAHTEFLRTKESIQKLIKEASRLDPVEAAAKLSFVVAGGGFAGIELVANLAEFVNLYKNRFPSLRTVVPDFRLIHSGPQILESLDHGLHRMRDYALRIFNESGIRIMLNSKIREITAEGVWLEKGQFISASMTISTMGQQAIPLKGTEDLKKDHLQRLYTNAYLQLEGAENIWGGGDACHVTNPFTHSACPPNALWAINQGSHAGRNIARAVLQRKLKPFRYRGLGQCASLGIGKGMGEMHGIVITGWISWILRLIFFGYFMPSRRVMWKVAKDWFHLWLYGSRIDMPVSIHLKNESGIARKQKEYRPVHIPVGI